MYNFPLCFILFSLVILLNLSTLDVKEILRHVLQEKRVSKNVLLSSVLLLLESVQVQLSYKRLHVRMLVVLGQDLSLKHLIIKYDDSSIIFFPIYEGFVALICHHLIETSYEFGRGLCWICFLLNVYFLHYIKIFSNCFITIPAKK